MKTLIIRHLADFLKYPFPPETGPLRLQVRSADPRLLSRPWESLLKLAGLQSFMRFHRSAPTAGQAKLRSLWKNAGLPWPEDATED